MKYKVGDEVLVKARIIEAKEEENVKYKIKRYGNTVPDNFASSIYVEESDIVSEKNMTAEEAWEIAKKLFADYSNTELDEIFGKGWSFPKLMELTPQQAKAKIEAWEQEKKIRVGDVVIETSDAGNEYIGVVTQITSAQNSVCIVNADGSTNITLAKKLKKTGRHIDITGLLEQIGVDER